jgi:hypothetical protein
MRVNVFIFLIGIVSGLAFADDNPDSAALCYLPIPDASMCPQPTELKRNPKTNMWSTNTGWKSESGSFSAAIVRFLGAQWKGVELGQILCLYIGPNSNDFPVGIYKNLIVYTPKSLLKNVPESSGYQMPWTVKSESVQTTMNCYSTTGSPCDCPFITYEEKVMSVDDTIRSIQQPSQFPEWGSS